MIPTVVEITIDNNCLPCPHRAISAIENIEQFGDASNLIYEAALWFSHNRKDCRGALIPFIRDRFPLTALQAIEAVKLGSALARGDRHE